VIRGLTVLRGPWAANLRDWVGNVVGLGRKTSAGCSRLHVCLDRKIFENQIWHSQCKTLSHSPKHLITHYL